MFQCSLRKSTILNAKSLNFSATLHTSKILILISYFSEVEPTSVIWNQKREMLTNGPTFPFGFRKNLAGLFGSVSLNKTHLMLIIGYEQPGVSHKNEFRVVVIDFERQIWHQYNNASVSINKENIESCVGAAVEFDKNGRR